MSGGDGLELREVRHCSEEYWQVVELRREVLRRPLCLEYSAEQLNAEAGDLHLALFIDAVPVACLLLTFEPPQRVRMRQVAVSPRHQRKGLASKLVAVAERLAAGRGAVTMDLHARETAIGFYDAMGYTTVGEPFEEVGIPHQAMTKRLLLVVEPEADLTLPTDA